MDIRPPTTISCSCFSFPPLCLYSQRQHQVVDSKYIILVTSGNSRVCWHSVSRALNPVPQGSASHPHPIWLYGKSEQREKRRGSLKQLTVEFYLFFKSVLSWSLPVSEVRTVGSVRWPCLIVWRSPLREIEDST